MAHSILDQLHYRNEEAAFAYFEKLLWSRGPVCPLHNKKTGIVCASLPRRIGKLEGVRSKPSQKGDGLALPRCQPNRGAVAAHSRPRAA